VCVTTEYLIASLEISPLSASQSDERNDKITWGDFERAQARRITGRPSSLTLGDSVTKSTRTEFSVHTRRLREDLRIRHGQAFSSVDRLVFAGLYRLAPGVLDALKILKPETVIRWHHAGFRTYWRWKSRARGGRPKTRLEIR
jgi:hypothetical protein